MHHAVDALSTLDIVFPATDLLNQLPELEDWSVLSVLKLFYSLCMAVLKSKGYLFAIKHLLNLNL